MCVCVLDSCVTFYLSCSRGSLFALVGCTGVSAGCRCFSPALLRHCADVGNSSVQEEVVTREITGPDTDWKYLTLSHKLTQELHDCCPSLPGRLTAEYRRAGTFVCLFVWCYTVITTVWDVDQCSCSSWICWDLSGPVPALSHITDRESLW